MQDGLVAHGVPVDEAHEIASTPRARSAAFLGYNPMEKLVPADTLHALPAAQQADITGTTFFPRLISDPFMTGLRIAFTGSLVMCLIAAAASWMRGKRRRPGDDGGCCGRKPAPTPRGRSGSRHDRRRPAGHR
jgi:hypothetical protein